MILHEKKVIFIHIPKTGGTSIEKLFGIMPFNSMEPNYDNLVGWCPKRKIYLQHATPEELLTTGLIDPKIFYSYKKITIVRNTYSRLVSDYYWHKNIINGRGKFISYLLSLKPFKARNVKSKGTPLDYSSHIRSQLDYITINGKVVIDEILSFENIKEIIIELSNRYSIDVPKDLHEKKGVYKKSKSELYNLFLKMIVRIKYYKEIKYFKYKF